VTVARATSRRLHERLRFFPWVGLEHRRVFVVDAGDGRTVGMGVIVATSVGVGVDTNKVAVGVGSSTSNAVSPQSYGEAM